MSTSTEAEAGTTKDLELVEGVFDRIAKDLAMILDRELTVSECAAERMNERPAGQGQVHISFRLGFQGPVGGQGCLLLPLPEAISLAGYLMMVEDDVVEENRQSTDLDATTKEAILELSNFVAGAADAVVRTCFPDGTTVQASGCQGVRADVRPALEYEEGAELVVGHASMKVHTFPEFAAVLILPAT